MKVSFLLLHGGINIYCGIWTVSGNPTTFGFSQEFNEFSESLLEKTQLLRSPSVNRYYLRLYLSVPVDCNIKPLELETSFFTLKILLRSRSTKAIVPKLSSNKYKNSIFYTIIALLLIF